MEQPKFSKAPSSMYNSYSNVPTGNVGNNLASGAPNTIRNQHSAYSTSLSHPYTYSSSYTEPQYMKYPTRSTGPTTPSGPDWNPPPSQQRDSYNNGGSNNSVFTNNSPHQPNSSNKNPSQQQQRNNNVTMSPPLHNNQWKIGSTNPAAQYGGGGSSGDSKDFTPFSPGYQISQQRDQMVLMNFPDSYRFSTQQQQTNNIQSNPSVVPQHYNQPSQQCLSLQPQNSIQNYRSLINSTRGNNNTSAVENSRGGYQNDQTKVSNQSPLMNHPHYHRMLLESNWEFNDQPKSWSQTLPQQPPPPQQQPQQFHPHQRPNLPPHPSTSAHLHTRGQRGNDVPPMSYADQHWQQQISNGGAQLHRQPPTTSSHDQDIMVHGSFGTWNPVDSDRGGPRNSNNLKSTSRYPNSVPPRRDAVKYCPNLRQNKGTGRLWEATAYEKKEKQNQVYSNNNQQQQRRNNNNVTNNTSPSTFNTSSASNNQPTTKLEQKIQVIQQSSKDESGGSDQNREDEIKFESWLESANFKWETKVVSEKSSQQQKKFVTIARLEGSDNATATGNGEGANETESRRAASKHLYNILDRSGIIDQHQINNKKELLKKSPPLESSTPPVTTATEEHSKNQKTAANEKESNKSQSDRPNNNATDTTSSNNHSSNNRNKSTKPRGHQQQGGKSKIPSLLSIVVPRPTVPHPPHFFPPLNNDYHHYGGGGHGEPSWSSPFHHWRHPGNHGFGGPHHNMDHPHHPHHHPHVIPPPNSANVTPFRDRSGGSTPVVPWYVYPHHHHGNHHHHHHGVGGPPHHRGGHHGPPPPGPPPLPPPNDVAMLEMMRVREMEHNWYEEQLHQESEVMCPEDIFINRMIMNQKEATRCAAGLPPPSMRSPRMSMIMPPDILPRDWNHPAPANKAKQTLDDKHVLAKHGAIYPHDDELKSVNDVVVLTEGILKALSDQFVNEDHPLPKDDDDEDDECGETNDNKTTTTTGGADGEQTNSKPSDKSPPTCNEKTDETAGGEFGGGETTTSNDQKEETMKNTEKKTQIKILKRPKRVPKKVPDTRPRVLCGVNRVGTLAKGLLIHGDNHVEMVLLCGSIPTKQLLERVLRHFPEQMKEARADLDYVIEHEDAGFSIVAKLTFTVKVSVTLTCVSLKPKDKKSSSSVTDDKGAEVTSAEVVETSSEDNKTNEDDGETVAEKKVDEVQDEDKVMDGKLNGKEEGDVGKTTEENDNNSDDKQPEVGDDVTTEFPEDMLPLECQLEALAKLRHAKWFIGRAHPQDSCVVIIRILREMQVRVPLWAPLSCWALENLIYLALSSSNEHMSPGDAFRRVFEVIAGGILLPDGPGILDPCEKIPVDVLDCCTAQQLEEITRNAQKALSLITFRGIHQVLGMAKITAHHNRHLLNVGGGRNLSSGIRSVVTKRQQQTNENTTAEEDDDDQDITSTDQITENNTQGVDSVNEEDDVEVEDSKSSTPRTEEKVEKSSTVTDATNDNDETNSNVQADQEENVDESTSSITTEKSTI